MCIYQYTFGSKQFYEHILQYILAYRSLQHAELSVTYLINVLQ